MPIAMWERAAQLRLQLYSVYREHSLAVSHEKLHADQLFTILHTLSLVYSPLMQKAPSQHRCLPPDRHVTMKLTPSLCRSQSIPQKQAALHSAWPG